MLRIAQDLTRPMSSLTIYHRWTLVTSQVVPGCRIQYFKRHDHLWFWTNTLKVHVKKKNNTNKPETWIVNAAIADQNLRDRNLTWSFIAVVGCGGYTCGIEYTLICFSQTQGEELVRNTYFVSGRNSPYSFYNQMFTFSYCSGPILKKAQSNKHIGASSCVINAPYNLKT